MFPYNNLIRPIVKRKPYNRKNFIHQKQKCKSTVKLKLSLSICEHDSRHTLSVNALVLRNREKIYI